MKIKLLTPWYSCPAVVPSKGYKGQYMLTQDIVSETYEVAAPIEYNPDWTPDKDDNRFFYVKETVVDPKTGGPIVAILEFMNDHPIEIVEMSVEEETYVNRKPRTV